MGRSASEKSPFYRAVTRSTARYTRPKAAHRQSVGRNSWRCACELSEHFAHRSERRRLVVLGRQRRTPYFVQGAVLPEVGLALELEHDNRECEQQPPYDQPGGD